MSRLFSELLLPALSAAVAVVVAASLGTGLAGRLAEVLAALSK